MQKNEELIIITKTYDLLETLIQAKYQRERADLLAAANLKLEIIRFQMRLAKDLQCVRFSRYEIASRAIEEIGRFLGGWSRRSPHTG